MAKQAKASNALVIDPNSLSVGDIEDIEEYVGKPISEVFKEGPADAEGNREVQLSGKALVAVVWVLKREADPDFTIEDARKVKITDFKLETNGVDPTDAAG